MAFTNTWDATYETLPLDTQKARLLGQNLRDGKKDIRERMDIEHDWLNSAFGRHKFSMGDSTARDAAVAEFVDGGVWPLNDGADYFKLQVKDSGATGNWKNFQPRHFSGTEAAVLALSVTDYADIYAYATDTGKLYVVVAGAWTEVSASTADLVPVGTVFLWSTDTPPSANYLMCDGAAVLRATYTDLDTLFSAKSYPYGNGDGSTTFNLPNLISKFPRGSAAVAGATGGADTHNHSTGSSSNKNAQGGSGVSVAANSHTHSVSTVSNIPAYLDMGYIIRVLASP